MGKKSFSGLRSANFWCCALIALTIAGCGHRPPAPAHVRVPSASPAQADSTANQQAQSAASTDRAKFAQVPSRKPIERAVAVASPEEIAPASVEEAGPGKKISHRLLRRAGKYPLTRIDEAVEQQADGSVRVVSSDAMVADHLLVTVKPGVTAEQLGQELGKLGFAIRKHVGGSAYLIEIPAQKPEDFPASLRTLSAQEIVAAAEPDRQVHILGDPSDPSFAQCWGLSNTGQTGGTIDADIDAPEAWKLSTGSASVRVGIIDTGIDYDHPDLAANIWSNPGETGTDALGRDKRSNGVDDDGNGYIDDWHGWDFANDDNDARDDHFHGTHVAGTIGAVGDNGVGVAGVCWRVSLVPLKFLDANGSGWTSDAVAAVDYATSIGVRLTSNSWGGGGFSRALQDAIESAGAQGILFVAAAGNSGSNSDLNPSYPAALPCSNIISVMATDSSDDSAGFSSIGNSSVDLGAPGVDIFSTMPHVATAAMTSYGLVANYDWLSGTSMATPHVSGACALLAAYAPQLSGPDIKQRILDTVDPLPSLTGLCQSGGRLNLDQALRNQKAPLILAALARPFASTTYLHFPTGATFTVTGTADGYDFDHYSIEAQSATDTTVWFTNGITLTGGGLQPVRDGVLASCRVPATSQGFWTLRLTITARSGATRALIRTIWVDPLLKPGFPSEMVFLAGSMYVDMGINATVADLDGDGRAEILSPAIVAGPLHGIDWRGKPVPGWPTDPLGLVFPSAADIDGDGRAEVALAYGYDDSSWGIADGHGRWLPGWPQTGTNHGCVPVLADVDGDHIPELVVAHADGKVSVMKANGAPASGWPQAVATPDVHSIAVADLDADGRAEVIAIDVNANASVYAWHGDGTPLTGFPHTFVQSYAVGIAIGDVTGDRRADIVVSGSNGLIHVLDANGNEQSGWPVSIGSYNQGGVSWPALADMDGDGIAEIFVAGGLALDLLRGNGTLCPGWPKAVSLGFLTATAPIVGDIDGDGQPDIVFTDSSKLHAYRSDGSALAGFPRTLEFSSNYPGAIADIDGDGRNEVILAASRPSGYGGGGILPHIYAWDYNAPGSSSGRIEWGQFGGDASHASVYRSPTSRPNVAPGIASQPSNSTVIAGQSATFAVTSIGTAPMTYQWFRNGAAIAGATSSQYATPATTIADNGAFYSVVVSNIAGSVTSAAAVLAVVGTAVAPSIVVQPADRTVPVGQTAMFTVLAKGTGPLSYQWRKNGADIAGATLGSYTTPATSLSDNDAVFSVAVNNAFGNATSSGAVLTVKPVLVPPTIVSSPTDQTVVEGETASFSVVASDPGPLTYQWQREGLPIPGATAPTYVIPAVSKNDTAWYRVVVSNSQASATSAIAELTVKLYFHPSISMQPANRTVAPGATATFTASAYGVPTPTYQWQKNGVDIPGATGGSYTTPAATLADDGTQFCLVARNKIGTAISNNATLSVKLTPIIVTQPSDQIVNVGQTATFSVSVSGSGPFGYQWKANGSNVTGATSATYTTAPTTLNLDRRLYTVVVTNAAGSTTSSGAYLTVKNTVVFPTIVTQPSNQTVVAGQTASFSVAASGTGPLTYQWRKNSVNISGATAATYTTPAITNASNLFNYSVVVTNSAGSATSSNATLTVLPAPIFKVVASPNVAEPGGTVSATWTNAKNPSPTDYIGVFTWPSAVAGSYSDRKYTNGTANGSFDLTVPTTPGSYSLRYLNSSNVEVAWSNVITVGSGPVPSSITTQPANQTVTAGQTATFSVVAAGDAPITYQWRKNGSNISGATSATYTTPGTSWISYNGTAYTVLVHNAGGDVISDEAILTVLNDVIAPVITVQPSDQAVAPGQTATFSVAVTGSPTIFYKWQKNGATISGATSATYTTPAAIAGEDGLIYRVIVSNSAGTVTSVNAKLSVSSGGPSIASQPADQRVSSGQTATFSVDAAGAPPLAYQWQKNGVDIAGATASSFTTPETTSSDNGATFRVVVSNSIASMISNNALLTVDPLPTPPSIVTSPSSKSVLVGQTATFSVGAKGTAPLSYQWKKNGVAIAGATSTSYTTPASTIADNGALFTAVVSNAAGSVSSNAAVLTVTPVNQLPIARISATPLSGAPPLPVSLDGSASSDPDGSINWYHWEFGDGMTDTGVAQNHTYAAAGTYVVKLTVRDDQMATSAATTITITVSAVVAPSIATQPTAQAVTVGNTATFSVVANGSAPLSYQWMKNGADIASATNASYTTPSTVLADSGSQFSVRVSNSAGTATSSSVALTVTPASDLIAHWKFDDGAGSVAADASGNGFAGTLVGSPSWVSGQFGGALAFSGSNYVQVANTTLLEVGKAGADFTVGYWLYLKQGATGSWRNIAHKGNADTDRTFAMWLWPSENRIHFRISTTANWNEGGDSAALIPLDAWTHVAYIKTGNALRLYVNGALDSQVALSAASVSSTGPITFGKDAWFAGINGNLDDIRIYNRALSAAEVSALVTVPTSPSIVTQPSNQTVGIGQAATFSVVAAGSAPLTYQWKKNGADIAGATGSAYTTPATTVSDNGAMFTVVVTNAIGSATSSPATLTVTSSDPTLVAWWKLDDAGGAVASDSSTYVNSANLGNGPTWIAGLNGGALSFNGVNQGMTRAVLSGLPNGNSPHTIAAFVKITALPSNRAWILLLGNDGGGSHHWLLNSAGGTQFGVWGGAQVAPSLPVGQWKHVATTFDGATLRGYVDGVLIGSVAASFNLAGVPLTFAQVHNGENYFNGQVDDLRIYSRALSAAEVATVATPGPQPPGFVAQPVNQSVTVGQTATFSVVMSGAAPMTYQWRSNGVPIAGATSSSYTTPPTTMADNGVLFSVIVSNAVGVSSSDLARLTVTGASNQAPIISSPAAASPNPASIGQTVALSIGANDPDGDTLAYAWAFGDGANGTGANCSHGYTASGIFTATVTVTDGRGGSATSSIAVTVASGTGLIGHWKLDDASGTQALDSSVSANHGSLSSGPTWSTGQVGGALAFDGADDRVTVADSAALRLSGDLTIAFWMRKTAEAADWQRMVGKGSATVRNYGVWEEAGAGKRILFQQYDASGNAVVNLFSASSIDIGSWHHVVCVVNGSSVGMYIDGVLDAATTRSGTAGVSSDPLTFAYAGYHTYFPGSLDDIRIFNRALTASEVTALLPAASGPRILVGGFESPSLAFGTFQYSPVGTAWTFTGAGVTTNSSGFTSGNPPAPERNQVCFVQTTGSATQSVDGFEAGMSYTFMLEAAQRGNYGTAEDFKVVLDSTEIGVFKPASSSYQTFTTSPISPGAGSHVLKLIGLNSAGGDATVFIDNIRISAEPVMPQSFGVLWPRIRPSNMDSYRRSRAGW